MKRFTKLFLLFPALFYGAVLLAQPANDDCSNAETLPCDRSVSGTTVNSVSEPRLSNPCLAGQFGVWYTFIGDGNPSTIRSTAGAGFDHALVIFSGSCGALTYRMCEDAAGGAGTETSVIFTGNGTVYYVYVADASRSSTGTFTISLACTPPRPANNECAGAIALTVNSGLACTSTTSGTTAGATQSRVGCIGDADDDVWYSFTATSSSHIVEISMPSTILVLQAFSDCGTPISGTCDDGRLIIVNLTGLTPGNIYYIGLSHKNLIFFNASMSSSKLS